MKQNLFLEPVRPYCNALQYDYNGSVKVANSEYGEHVLYFCEFEDKCGKPFYITKVEQEPLYQMNPYISEKENE